MEQMNPQPQNPQPQNTKPANHLATVSLVVGIFALICCCLPPLQLLLGSTAMILAVLSKKGQPFCGQAIAGLILGIIAILVSIMIFAYLIFVIDLMQDPANAAKVSEFMNEYQNILNGQ